MLKLQNNMMIDEFVSFFPLCLGFRWFARLYPHLCNLGSNENQVSNTFEFLFSMFFSRIFFKHHGSGVKKRIHAERWCAPD